MAFWTFQEMSSAQYSDNIETVARENTANKSYNKVILSRENQHLKMWNLHEAMCFRVSVCVSWDVTFIFHKNKECYSSPTLGGALLNSAGAVFGFSCCTSCAR